MACSLVLAFLALAAGDSPRPLEGRALDNLVAFTRLLGYVQYFHPSDAAAAADWNQLAVDGMRAVESATDDASLIQELESLFRPVAPTVDVYQTGASPAPALALVLMGSDQPSQIVRWVHHGLGTGDSRSIYHSDRVREWLDAAAIAAGVRAPSQTFVTELIPGITARIPLSLYTALENGAAAPAEGTLARRKPTDFSPADRAVRLATIAAGWNALQHFYPYFDVVETDWPAALRTCLSAAALATDAKSLLPIVERLVAELHDGHGNVYCAGAPLGVRPPLVWDWIEDQLVVTEPTPTCGIERGDAVVAIDGVPVAQAIAECEGRISGATPGWIRWKALNQSLGEGPKDSKVALELERPDGDRYTATCKRSVTPQSAPHETRPDTLAELRPGIWYVDLDRMTSAEFAKVVPDLAKARGIVFDLRGYPTHLEPMAFFGHLTQTPMTSAQWHIPLVTYPDHQQMSFERGGEWDIQPIAPYFTAKKVFLTDGRAISYAESCMGIVEHYHLAEIVGATTAGTNGNINAFTLPGGYTIIFTGMKVLKHDGTRHHGVGIRPTIAVERTREGVIRGEDELLQKAIEVASG